MSEFGETLRKLRGGRSLRDVARQAHLSKTHIGDLELGRRAPTAQVAATLDRALEAEGELIALAEVAPVATLVAQADTLRRGLHQTLMAGPLSEMGLDEVEWTVDRHGRATRYRSETELLPDLMADFRDLRLRITARQSNASRNRLTMAVARMAGLMALTLLKMGDEGAKEWWRIGRAAATAAGDLPTLSWMYAQEAYQLYYSGDLYGAIELAARAQHLATGIPCAGPALAAPLEARAHARLGRPEDTARALGRARSMLDQLPAEQQADSAFGYTESQAAFHAGDAWTHLGDAKQATPELDRALRLYPASDQTDRALTHLDQAACVLLAGDPAAAAEQAAGILQALEPNHRSALIIGRAQDLADKVPEARNVPEAKALRELLAQPRE